MGAKDYYKVLCFIVLITFFQFRTMSQDLKRIVEYSSYDEVEILLNDAGSAEIEELTIQILGNKDTWYSYGRNPFEKEDARNKPSFRIKQKVDSLPNFASLSSLKVLSLEFLGLESIPEGLDQLEKLEELNISFNYITLSSELDYIVSMKSLKQIMVFGIEFNEEDISRLREGNTSLSVLYSQEDDIKRFK